MPLLGMMKMYPRTISWPISSTHVCAAGACPIGAARHIGRSRRLAGSRSTQVDLCAQPALACAVDRAPSNDDVLYRVADGLEEA